MGQISISTKFLNPFDAQVAKVLAIKSQLRELGVIYPKVFLHHVFPEYQDKTLGKRARGVLRHSCIDSKVVEDLEKLVEILKHS
jgi:hypothetical protein